MNDLVAEVGPYGWWIAGLALLVLEVVVPGVYLLFFGIAALIVGTNAVILSQHGWFGWEEQVVAFVIVSVAVLYLGRRWYGTRDAPASAIPLNRRADRLIGQSAILSEAIVGGRGRIKVEDSWWTVEGPELPAGSRVRIEGAKGTILTVSSLKG